MAERRMFARSVMVLGSLSELSHSAQVLYMALNMLADDDGFVGNARVIMRQCRCTAKHLQALLEGGFLLEFPGGVLAIAHWLVHNQLRKDRYKPTIYQAEFSRLAVRKNEPYRLLAPDEAGGQNGNPVATQDRIGKERKGKARIGKDRSGEDTAGAEAQAPAENGGSSSSFTAFEKAILDFYSQYCRGMVECLYLDKGLREKITQLQQLGWSLEGLENAFRIAGTCEFLKGENKDGWICSLDWLCQDDNLRKLCAGKYQPYKKKETVTYGCNGLGQEDYDAIRKFLQEN